MSLLKHISWSVKLFEFRLAWKPKNEYSYTSIAIKLNAVTARSEGPGAQASQNTELGFLDPINTLRTESFKLFKRPFPGYLTILTL